MVVLAYVIVVQAVLAFGAATQHLSATSASVSTGVICPAHVEGEYLRPDQPAYAQHDDLCCVAHCGLIHAWTPLSNAAVETVQYTRTTGPIRAPPDAAVLLRPVSSPVGSRAPPRLG